MAKKTHDYSCIFVDFLNINVKVKFSIILFSIHEQEPRRLLWECIDMQRNEEKQILKNFPTLIGVISSPSPSPNQLVSQWDSYSFITERATPGRSYRALGAEQCLLIASSQNTDSRIDSKLIPFSRKHNYAMGTP